MRRFFILPEKIATGVPEIVGGDAAHIVQVLRYKTGQIIAVFDGQGNEYKAKIIALKDDRVQVSILNKIAENTEHAVEITVAQGFLKEKKMDVLVRQLSEVGAMHWVPFPAKRSVALPDARRIANRKARWEKIAIEAAKQCGRNHTLSIEPVPSFDQLLEKSSDFDFRIIFYEKESLGLKTQVPQTKNAQNKILIVLGPEGGFDSAEVSSAMDKSFISAGLGPRILRAETAAVVACALVQYIFGDLGK